MTELNERTLAIYNFIIEYTKEYSYPPTQTEITPYRNTCYFDQLIQITPNFMKLTIAALDLRNHISLSECEG